MTVLQLKRQVITKEVKPYETRIYENQEEVRQNFEQYLIEECDYSPVLVSESDDWRDEFARKEYTEYVLENEPKLIQARKKIAQRNFTKYAEDYPDEARDLLCNLQG